MVPSISFLLSVVMNLTMAYSDAFLTGLATFDCIRAECAILL